MRAPTRLAMLSGLLAAAPLSGQSPALSAGALVGYQGGLGIQAFGTVRDVARGLPLTFRLRLGRTSVEPGSPSAARRIFINNATNGTPVATARTWDAGLDVLLPRGPRTCLWAGLRRSSFVANFKYVGGNEDFDVRSSEWGLAAGMERGFPMSDRLELLVSGGAEWYHTTRLQGHDTSYSPDGEDVNPREEFTYADADEAVGQPKLRAVLMVGISYRTGR